MCPPNIRRLFNNICNFQGCRYLEVGSYLGASLASAAYDNPGLFYGIDDFSQFNNNINRIKSNIDRFPNIQFYEANSWEIDLSLFHDINVYFYDGDHSTESQEQAITYFWPCLSHQFIWLVDDYSWPEPFKGTQAALKRLDVELKIELHDDRNKTGWWNGLLVALCRKSLRML